MALDPTVERIQQLLAGPADSPVVMVNLLRFAQELQAISQESCTVLSAMGPPIQWVQSYATDDKSYCVYVAPNEEAVREHARQGRFPADQVSRVRSGIDPTTAE